MQKVDATWGSPRRQHGGRQHGPQAAKSYFGRTKVQFLVASVNTANPVGVGRHLSHRTTCLRCSSFPSCVQRRGGMILDYSPDGAEVVALGCHASAARSSRLARRLLGFRRQYGADEFHESSSNSEEQTKKVKPGCVQPMIKGGANQPARHGCGWKRKSKLAVPRDLKPEASFLGIVVLVWQARFGPSGRSLP